MKKITTLLSIFILSVPAFSQITITNSDMPSPNDTVRISTAVQLSGDAEATGANYLWDFTLLQSSVQKVDSFLAVSETPLVYNVVFNLPWDPNHATVAIKQGIASDMIPGIPVEDNFDFLANDNTSYRKVGFGATVNGITIPVQYSSPEVLCSFPMNYMDNFSSVTNYEVSVPTIGFFGEKIERNSYVDGWGTLKLPMGDFDVLRVASEVIRTDTIYYEAMSIGFALPPVTTMEYKWIGQGKSEPLLQINSTIMASTVLYQDVVPEDTSTQSISNIELSYSCNLYPNPTNGILNVDFGKDNIDVMEIEIIDLSGRVNNVLSTGSFSSRGNILSLNCSELNLLPGQYYIKIKTSKSVITRPFTFERN